MQYYSTRKNSAPVSLSYAVLKGLADDGGLYMPERLPAMSSDFLKRLPGMSLQEIAAHVAEAFLGEDVPAEVIRTIAHETMSFEIPLRQLNDRTYTLELFHGPTMAFKDVGARFMSRLMAWLQRDEKRNLKVVVATSGDTGSAVAAGFYDVPGIEVFVLFPKGKVSPLQQKQITTWGKNIKAVEVNGTFDDCQKLAKQVLGHKELNNQFRITSANSINIARLIPQSFYYFAAAAQLNKPSEPLVFCVPSGNFGNLTAGLLANIAGLPVSRFVAATNINDVVPGYCQSGEYRPRPSVQTISNAMDVGDPSNFDRMMDIFQNSHPQFCEKIISWSFTDLQVRDAIQKVFSEHRYLMDPHGAVGWLGAQKYLTEKDPSANIIFLETAHPAKFPETLQIWEEKIGSLPFQLESLLEKEEMYESIENDFTSLVELVRG